MSADEAAREANGFTPKGKTAPIQWLALPREIDRPDSSEGCNLEFLKIPWNCEKSMAEEAVLWRCTRWSMVYQR